MSTDDTSRAEPDDGPVRVVLVSGFLGAGKTTALETVAGRLTERGHTVGMITNDQATGLVDTSILEATGGAVVEIPGGCFCCNFEDLLRAAHSIRHNDVDVLLAEPVGSCTDLVATVVNPLEELHGGAFDVAPLSAVVDPDRVRAHLSGEDAALPEEVRYIFRMQIEEADLVLLNKTDTLGEEATDRLIADLSARVGDRPVVPVSAERGDGMDAWVSAVVDGEPGAVGVDGELGAEGRALDDIDYDTYADGEAKLGWLNLTAGLEGPLEVGTFRAGLMDRLRAALRADGIEVAHLKFSVAAAGELSRANLTSTNAAPRYSGGNPGTVGEGRLVLNARAVGDPERIRGIAEEALAATGVDADIEEIQAFRPEYPEPVHRMPSGS